jgi:hypothetical protein
MRAALSPTGLLPLLLSAACGGGDLTLPGPGQPATLAIVAGDGQHGTQGQPLTDPLVVQVLDRDQLPVAGTDVAFGFTDSVPGAAVDPGTTLTDTQGRASAHVQLGSRVGAQPIEALVAMPGQDLRVRFQLTALANAGGGGKGGGGDESSGSAGGSAGGGAGGAGAGSGGGNGGTPAPPPPASPPPPSSGGSGGGDKSGSGHGSGHGDGHANGHGDGHGHGGQDD